MVSQVQPIAGTIISPVPRRRRVNWLPYALAIPLLIYEAIFILYPIYEGIRASFTKQAAVGRPSTWVGLDNYRRMLSDEGFWSVMATTLIYMLLVVVVAVGFGLGSAMLLNRPLRGRAGARAIITLPWAFPDVPTVLIFVWILNPNFGVANVFAQLLPWVGENPKWLFDSNLAMGWVVLITAWKGFPFYSLVILAALQTVPNELHEAARLDGASRWQGFLSVTLPGISPTLLLLTVLATIYAFKQFTIIWLLTGGGPSGATETIVIQVYQTAFRFHNFPYASTLGVAGFVMAFTVALVFLAIQRRQEMEVS